MDLCLCLVFCHCEEQRDEAIRFDSAPVRRSKSAVPFLWIAASGYRLPRNDENTSSPVIAKSNATK